MKAGLSIRAEAPSKAIRGAPGPLFLNVFTLPDEPGSGTPATPDHPRPLGATRLAEQAPGKRSSLFSSLCTWANQFSAGHWASSPAAFLHLLSEPHLRLGEGFCILV